jgi:UDP-N-acetylglucosamine--N-acetylmuramyl-(pentapeptide) pyrophosphoryl-undecaprenol N-acetylglucosamine transferase
VTASPAARPIPLTILFAGGGTGGHLYPGLAITEAFPEALAQTSSNRDFRSIFLCSDRAIDRRILENAHAQFQVIRAKPLILRPVGLARFALALPRAIRETRAIIRRERAEGREVILAAMGGFVAAPCVRAAKLARIPIVLVNLDAVPGKANEWIARRVDRILTSAPVSRPGWAPIGPIVRAAARPQGSPADCRLAFGLDPDRPMLFISGGSQGARSINALFIAFAQHHAHDLRSWQILHQTGAGEASAVEAAYRAAGLRAVVREFLDPIGPAWGAASLAVCRAGAGTVAEVWASRCPALFLPYPHHADQHQTANAQALCNSGAAVLELDHIDPALNLAHAGQTMLELLRTPTRLDAMRAAAATLGPAHGAASAASALLDLASKGPRDSGF